MPLIPELREAELRGSEITASLGYNETLSGMK
jgi:hypothetical protein